MGLSLQITQGTEGCCPVEATTSMPQKKKKSDSEEEEASGGKYVGQYKAEPTISTVACPLKWWSEHAATDSKLAHTAGSTWPHLPHPYFVKGCFSCSSYCKEKESYLTFRNVNKLVCLSSGIRRKM